jgi:hypothetical protein
VVVVTGGKDGRARPAQSGDDRREVLVEGPGVEPGVQRVVDPDQQRGQLRARGDGHRQLLAADAGHACTAPTGVDEADPVGSTQRLGQQGAEAAEPARSDRVTDPGSSGVAEYGQGQHAVLGRRGPPHDHNRARRLRMRIEVGLNAPCPAPEYWAGAPRADRLTPRARLSR